MGDGSALVVYMLPMELLLDMHSNRETQTQTPTLSESTNNKNKREMLEGCTKDGCNNAFAD